MFAHLPTVRAFSLFSHRFLAECGQLTEYVCPLLVCAGL